MTKNIKKYLRENEIHLWQASLERWPEPHSIALNLLCAQELQRGDRFLREEHRRRFCLARAFLRVILAHYVGMAPEQLQFREGTHGKPYLDPNPDGLQFNLSHSQDQAIYAINLGESLGVDIEWISPEIETQPLAARFFTPGERQRIASLPEDQQRHAFYQIWTRKEAVMKATGLGLSGLSQSTVGDQNCSIIDLKTVLGYTAALAIVGAFNTFPKKIRYKTIQRLNQPLTSGED